MINRVVLIGRLTKDVEVRKTASGLSVAQFTVACEENTKGENGEKKTNYINCVAWRQTADVLSAYTRKGNLIGLEGRIQTRNYDGQDGKRVYVTEVVCDSIQFLERKKESQQEERPSYSEPSPSPANTPVRNARNEDYDPNLLNIRSDDLPW